MNYTHEEILEALKVIHNVCDNTTCECCPFELNGDCMIQEAPPEDWHFIDTDGKWRAFA